MLGVSLIWPFISARTLKDYFLKMPQYTYCAGAEINTAEKNKRETGSGDDCVWLAAAAGIIAPPILQGYEAFVIEEENNYASSLRKEVAMRLIVSPIGVYIKSGSAFIILSFL